MSKRLGNAVDPFETIKKFGADATRWYMITNAQPWDNLKFDTDGIIEVQRKFSGHYTTPTPSLRFMQILIISATTSKRCHSKSVRNSIAGFYRSSTHLSQ